MWFIDRKLVHVEERDHLSEFRDELVQIPFLPVLVSTVKQSYSFNTDVDLRIVPYTMTQMSKGLRKILYMYYEDLTDKNNN